MIRNISLKKASEDGVALIFALAMLALLLIMLLGFLASSLLEQRIAYSYRDDVGSRLLVRSALVHARKQLSSTSDDMLWMRNGSTEEKIIAPIGSMSGTNPARLSSSSTAASQNDGNGNPRYGYNALKPLLKRYFGPDTEPASPPNMENNWQWRNWLPDGVNMYYPEWIYYYNNPSHERMTGRMAYVIVPNMGINLSSLAAQTTTRLGIHVNEMPVSSYLSSAGLTRLTRLNNWLSPDILLGYPGLYHYNAPNQYFATIAQPELSSNFYSGQLGGTLSGTATPGNYRELASLYFTTNRADAPPQGFDASSRSRARSMSGFPAENTFTNWQSFIGGQFDITDTRLDQAAANAVDYSDADSIPTSDVAPADWLTGDAQPNYTGNERTPYINQIVPAIEISAKYEYRKTNSGLLRSRIIQNLTFTPEPKGKLFVELINLKSLYN